MSTTLPSARPRRTVADVALGVLLVLAGLVLLGNTVLATALSVLILGWTTLVAGAALLVRSLLRWRSEGLSSTVLGAAVLIAVGLFILRNPLAGAVALTLVAGAMFLASGIARVFMAPQLGGGARILLLLGGLVSIGLGLWVVFNLSTATLTLLGVMVGVQTVVEGVSLIAVGRLRPSSGPEATTAARPTPHRVDA